MWTAVELFFAGIWPLVWHWGAFVGVSILCVVGAVATDAIPLIGPWLSKERKWLMVTAAISAGCAVCIWIGASDARRQCTAKTVVIETVVDKAVSKAKEPTTEKDPNDNPNN